jgi:hypothetical protein
MKPLLFSLLLPALAAVAPLQAGGSIGLSHETLAFDRSVQKKRGRRLGLDLRGDSGMHRFRFSVEHTDTETFQPPLNENLDVDKLYAGYSGALPYDLRYRIGYLRIHDNIAPTDDGHVYSLGLQCSAAPTLKFAVSRYESRYPLLEVSQTDLSGQYGMRLGEFRTDLRLIVKQIDVSECSDPWCRNAKRRYVTPGFRLHGGWREYHGGVAAFFGKRAFAVMDEGSKVQHHAMAFDRTWMTGLGHRFGPHDLTLRYTRMRAEELPMRNPNVTVDATALIYSRRF